MLKWKKNKLMTWEGKETNIKEAAKEANTCVAIASLPDTILHNEDFMYFRPRMELNDLLALKQRCSSDKLNKPSSIERRSNQANKGLKKKIRSWSKQRCFFA